MAGWTLDELVAKAAEVLSQAGVGQASGRVRELPDRRTVRYYTTLGMIDRPTEFRSRQAIYGERHLLQLVAIKRMQSRGEPLHEIQRQVVGATETQLRRAAEMPEEAARPKVTSPRRRPTGRRAGAFWAETPSEPDLKLNSTSSAQPMPAGPMRVELANGVELVLNGPRRPTHPDDLEALRAAAGPLLRMLHIRHLL
jgi:DNA-binding transcriptional MerR regulator